MEPVDSSAWSPYTPQAHREYETLLKPLATPGTVQMAEIVGWLDANLPEDAIVTNGAGNYATWVHRYFQYKRFRTCLAPTSGSMGYGVPAGVAAKLVHPDRVVVSVNGDGDRKSTRLNSSH